MLSAEGQTRQNVLVEAVFSQLLPLGSSVLPNKYFFPGRSQIFLSIYTHRLARAVGLLQLPLRTCENIRITLQGPHALVWSLDGALAIQSLFRATQKALYAERVP